MPELDDDTLNNDQDEELDEDVETDNSEDEDLDENSEDKEEDDDSQGDDEDSDDSDDDKDSEDEDETKFTKAFVNIKGDSPEEYAKNLEEAYRQSSREGKLKAKSEKDLQTKLDAIAAAVAKDPELAKKINELTGDPNATVDPALLHARQEMEDKMESDYNKFVEKHPELDTDPDLQEKVLAEVTVFGDAARKKGKILSMDEALRKAWISLGLDNEDSKDKVLNKAKETAGKPKTSSSNKKTSKAPQLTTEQIAVGKKMGLTEKQMLASLSKK